MKMSVAVSETLATTENPAHLSTSTGAALLATLTPEPTGCHLFVKYIMGTHCASAKAMLILVHDIPQDQSDCPGNPRHPTSAGIHG